MGRWAPSIKQIRAVPRMNQSPPLNLPPHPLLPTIASMMTIKAAHVGFASVIPITMLGGSCISMHVPGGLTALLGVGAGLLHLEVQLHSHHSAPLSLIIQVPAPPSLTMHWLSCPLGQSHKQPQPSALCSQVCTSLAIASQAKGRQALGNLATHHNSPNKPHPVILEYSTLGPKGYTHWLELPSPPSIIK